MSISFNLSADLSALSDAQLADRYGKELAIAKTAKEAADATKSEILSRGINEARGAVYKAKVISASEREGFDTKIAKTFLTAQELEACRTVVSVSASVRIYGA